MNYQWYPGHMTKAIRMMQENISLVDMIIELTDARIPLSGRNPDIDELGKNKERLIILNKADLADPKVTALWTKYFEEQGLHVMQLNSKQGKDNKKVLDMIRTACADKIERDKKRGIKNRPIRAMVAGIPNVGKSTFINRISGKSAAKTGNKPGVTKGKQWIMLGKDLQLLDTPGILWPKFDDEIVGLNLALIGSMNDVNLDIGEMAASLIKYMDQYYKGVIEEKYSITTEQIEGLDDMDKITRASEILTCVAINRKCYIQGGRPDLDRASNMLLDDFRSGRLGLISLERPNIE